MTDTPPPPPSDRQSLRIGAWIARPDLNRLSGEGATVQVEPRLMDLLLCLASRPNEVWSRRELLDRVWADAVVNEEALTRGVSELRRILGDDPQHPGYIETIRKGGYRLVAPVAPVPKIEAGVSKPTPSRRRRWSILVQTLIGVAILLVIVLRDRDQEPPAAPLTPLVNRPLTAYPGIEQYPALSPDGSLVAFTWDGPESDNLDIYVKQIGRENPLRLTDHAGWDAYPVWLPGQEELAYLHGDAGGVGILAVPLLGGESRAILGPLPSIYGLAFTPDGRFLVYAAAEEQGGAGRLRRRDLATGEDRELLTPPPEQGFLLPLIGPDGHTVVMISRTSSKQDQILVTDLDGAAPRALTGEVGKLEGLCWHRNGGELVVSSRQSGEYSLWRVDLETGAFAWLPVHGEWMFFPHMGFESDRLVYQHRRFEKNVWQVQLGDEPTQGLATDPVLVSTHWDCGAQLDLAGERLAFTSSRSGNLEIWMSHADGSQPVQLTSFAGPQVGNPRWSPDGSRLAFAAGPDGWSNLFVIDVATRQLTRLTEHTAHDLAPSWSANGAALYTGSNRSGSWQVWRVSETTTEMITTDGGAAARATPDGRTLYYTRRTESGLWRRDLATGDTEQILCELPHAGHWSNWDLWHGGLVLVEYDDDGPQLMSWDLVAERLEPIARVPSISNPSLTVAANGRTILYARIENNVGDLRLVEDFR